VVIKYHLCSPEAAFEIHGTSVGLTEVAGKAPSNLSASRKNFPVQNNMQNTVYLIRLVSHINRCAENQLNFVVQNKMQATVDSCQQTSVSSAVTCLAKLLAA